MRMCMVLVVAAAGLAAGRFVAVGKGPAPAQPAEGKTPVAADSPVQGERAADFVAAFNKGDAAALAGFWTPAGDYIDQAGEAHKGRAAIEKMYAKHLAENKGAKLTVVVTSKKQVGADVVLEDGLTEVAPADGGPGTVGRFSAVLVRKDGAWYFESVRESVARPPSHVARFEAIDWLIGDWVGEAEKGESAVASYTWAENQNFIVSSFATTLNGVPVLGGTQWVGYDAVEKQIRSWTFYSGGGVGEGRWAVDGNTVRVKLTARTADGKTVTAVNVMTKVDPDHATFQATQLTVDGQAMPDSPAIRLKRDGAK